MRKKKEFLDFILLGESYLKILNLFFKKDLFCLLTVGGEHERKYRYI